MKENGYYMLRSTKLQKNPISVYEVDMTAGNGWYELTGMKFSTLQKAREGAKIASGLHPQFKFAVYHNRIQLEIYHDGKLER
jgi:hypothetical protein